MKIDIELGPKREPLVLRMADTIAIGRMDLSDVAIASVLLFGLLGAIVLTGLAWLVLLSLREPMPEPYWWTRGLLIYWGWVALSTYRSVKLWRKHDDD